MLKRQSGFLQNTVLPELAKEGITIEEYSLLPDVFAVQAWDGMQAVDLALQAVKGDTTNKDAFIAALENVKFKSPRGDFEFDKDTHNPIQDIYIREVKVQSGQAVNTIVGKVARVTDPGK